MRALVEFPLQNGGSVLVWSEDAAQNGATTRGVSSSRTVRQATSSFEEAVARIRPAADAVLAALRDHPDPPSEICVQFGVELHAEAGAFIATTGAAANFHVSMTWRAGGP